LKFSELKDLPITVTQVTPHIYGEDTRGVSISCKAQVKEGFLEFDESPSTADMWGGENDSVTEIGKLMTRPSHSHELKDMEMDVSISTSNEGPLFETKDCHKLSVNDASPKSNREIEFKFSISFYNTDGDLDDVQRLMKMKGLTLSTKLLHEQDEQEDEAA